MFTGANMIYLVSRSVARDSRAGMVSPLGVAAGSLFYLLLACLGLAAVFAVAPAAYTALKWAGAAYLPRLAWQAIGPGAALRAARVAAGLRGAPVRDGARHEAARPQDRGALRLPAAAVRPPERGPVLARSPALGLTRIAVSLAVNARIVFGAGSLPSWLIHRPVWLRVQRWSMTMVLGTLAFRLATERARP